MCDNVSFCVCLITMHRVSVLSRRLSLRAVLQGRVIDYWLEQTGARGAAGAQTRELQAGHGFQLISLSLEAAELNLEQALINQTNDDASPSSQCPTP